MSKSDEIQLVTKATSDSLAWLERLAQDQASRHEHANQAGAQLAEAVRVFLDSYADNIAGGRWKLQQAYEVFMAEHAGDFYVASQ